jgi:hypothetical protein
MSDPAGIPVCWPRRLIARINESNLVPPLEKGMSGREADNSSTDNRDPHRASCSG